MTQRILYSDPTNKHFFHIPEDTELPAGDLILRSLSGKKLEVAAVSVQIFEVPEARAKELAAVEMKRLADVAARMMTGAGGFLRGIASALPTPQAPPPGREKRRTTIADALGVTEEQLSNDPEAVIAGIKQIGAGLGELLRDAVAKGVSEEESERRKQALLTFLREQLGEEAAVTAENLPETLRGYLSNPELEEKLKEAAAGLREASEQLKSR